MAEGGIEMQDFSFHDNYEFDDESQFIGRPSLQEEMRLSQTVNNFH